MFILLPYIPAVITHGGQQLGRSKQNAHLKGLAKLRREKDLEVASSPPGLALDRQVEGNTVSSVALKAAEKHTVIWCE